MVDNKLLENLNRLGFPLMEVSADLNVNQTLADVVKSKETRLWEAFPVLLANAAQDYSFDYTQVVNALAEGEEQTNLHGLLLLSLALYQSYHLSFLWAKKLKQGLSGQDVALLKDLRNSLTHAEFVTLGEMRFHASRLKEMFNNYFEQNAEKTRQLKEKHEELSLEYSLSQVFSAKQKELFKKKLEGLPLSKTEKEYFSRTVKKKVSALANPELHRLAQKILDY
jgi:hypothetical protein